MHNGLVSRFQFSGWQNTLITPIPRRLLNNIIILWLRCRIRYIVYAAERRDFDVILKTLEGYIRN